MTEQEWLTCSDPEPMLAFLWGKASDRKLRLFRCACCRRFWDELSTDPVLQQIVETGENYADGLIFDAAFRDARKAHVSQHRLYAAVSFAVWPKAGDQSQVNRMACGRLRWTLVTSWFQGQQDRAVEVLQLESKEQCILLRDIFGNPFWPPVVIDPAWLSWNDRTVAKLAEGVYKQRRFEDLPILADALEDAGCADSVLVEHLRGPGPHVRGCFALDLLLGRE